MVQSQSVRKDNAGCETRYTVSTGPGTYGPFPVPAELHTIGLHSERELFMHRELIRDGLLVTLAGRYKEDPVQFVMLSKRTLDSSVAREAVAELRNEGYVEEQVRGVIRLTPRGYRAYRNEPLPYAYKN